MSRLNSAICSRLAVAVNTLCLALSVSSCGGSGGSNPGPQRSPNPNDPNGPDGSGLNLSGRPLKLTNLKFIRTITNMN